MADMKITVEMTAELFEEFMQFRKCKDTYEQKAKQQIDSIRGRMERFSKSRN